MDNKKDHDEYADASCGVKTVHKKHTDAADDCSDCCARPIEIVERRTKIGCRADAQQEAS